MIQIFGSDIGRLHQYSIEIYNTSNTSTSRKRPLFIIQSKSGQNKYFAFFETEIGSGAYRSIKTLLGILIPIWKNTSPILKEGDTINVMSTYCLLNEKEKVLKPNNQYL
ncbi:hypothetical protein Glove_139g356 [Diversispora epigaea]|uniref:Uncharacterized protein n=1 Tax=Diversispora epigaea TaxID=1348612 RepID=A0A397IVS9_9GLOM|nr:hypothetical protein Glove_139g356 [Diversispora epigaea]